MDFKIFKVAVVMGPLLLESGKWCIWSYFTFVVIRGH